MGEGFKVDKMGSLLCNDRNCSNTVGRSKVEGRKELGDVAKEIPGSVEGAAYFLFCWLRRNARGEREAKGRPIKQKVS